MKRLINQILGKFGFYIINKNRYNQLAHSNVMMTTPQGTIHPMAMPQMLERLKMRPPINIETVIDVGASDGSWSNVLMPSYPNANYLLIDANQYHEAGLQKFVQNHPKSQYVIAAAGDIRGEIYFHIDNNNPLGGSSSHTPLEGYVPVPVTTIDHEIDQRNLSGPYLIKLDTHGFEVQILEGAKKTLEQTNMLIIEAYNFTLMEGTLRFYELCIYLEERGFRVVDFYEPYHRADGVFWQIDFCFIRADRPEFAHNRYNP